MQWIVDPSDQAPLYAQLVASVRTALGRGDLRPGERLPAARDLAEALDLNMHTVLRAYQLLRDEGIVELRRGRGAVVRSDLDPRAPLHDQVDELLATARRLGLDTAALVRVVTDRAHQIGDPR